MKQSFKIIGIALLSTSLSFCASMIENPKEKANKVGTRNNLSDQSFNRSSTECPNGVLLAVLFHDVTKGNELYFDARGALSKDVISDDDLNLYILARGAHRGFDKEKLQRYAKADLKPPFPSLAVKLSSEAVGGSSTRAMSDPEAMQKAKVGDNIALKQDKKAYYGVGSVSDGKLSEQCFKSEADVRKMVRSLAVTTDGGDSYMPFNVPTSVIGTSSSDFIKGLSATAGGELQFKIEPSDQASSLFVQITNDKPKEKGVTHQYVESDIQGKSEITIPLKGVDKGSYIISILRIQGNEADFADEIKACVDIATGVRTTLSIEEAKKE